MYIVVLGLGKFGYHLTRTLLVSGHEVLAIDRDPLRCEKVTEEMGSVTLVGDGCEAGVLEEAGASRADILVALTGNDEDNLVACQMAKHRFKVPRTISLVNNPKNQGLFKALGIDVTVSSTDIVLAHIEKEIAVHHLVHLMPIEGSNREIVGIRVPPGAKVVGRPLREIQLPPGSIISLIVREGGNMLTPRDDVRLRADDQVVAVTTPEEEASLWAVFT